MKEGRGLALIGIRKVTSLVNAPYRQHSGFKGGNEPADVLFGCRPHARGNIFEDPYPQGIPSFLDSKSKTIKYAIPVEFKLIIV